MCEDRYETWNPVVPEARLYEIEVPSERLNYGDKPADWTSNSGRTQDNPLYSPTPAPARTEPLTPAIFTLFPGRAEERARSLSPGSIIKLK